MRTIQLQIPDELADQLDPYQNNLIEVLQIGMHVLQHRMTNMDEIWLKLAQTGRVILPQRSSSRYQRQRPLSISGQPLSEIVIEQRGTL